MRFMHAGLATAAIVLASVAPAAGAVQMWGSGIGDTNHVPRQAQHAARSASGVAGAGKAKPAARTASAVRK